MATPIGHGLLGVVVYLLGTQRTGSDRWVPLLTLTLFAAVAPDLDFLPGLLVGKPALYHQGISHSLIFAVFAAALCAIFPRRTKVSRAALFGLVFFAYVSHLFLDFFGPDTRPPYGIPIFWPVNDVYFQSPVIVLPGVWHARRTGAPISEWLVGVLSWHNVLTVLKEAAALTPAVLLTAWLRKRRAAR